MKVISNLLVLFLLILPSVLQAQTTSPNVIQKGSKILVNVPVVVSDREGRRISGLKKEDFMLFQGGNQQTISSFTTEEEPVTVALLLDTSGSTQGVLDKIKDAAKDFIDVLNPKDQCLIATFDSRVNVLIPFTSNREELKKSLDKIQTADREGSIMHSAVNQIVENSFARTQGRKALVILSDGKDFGSDISRKDLMESLEESDISIYPIYYQSGIGFNKPIVDPRGIVTEGKEVEKPKKEKKPKKRKKVYTVLIPVAGDTYNTEEIKLIDKAATTGAVSTLKELSDLTSGRFYQSDTEKLSSIFKQVASDLRQQYLLSFYLEGTATDAAISSINIKVDRPNVVVQTRTKFLSKDF
jgi:Ca-activated chloride channel family protein